MFLAFWSVFSQAAESLDFRPMVGEALAKGAKRVVIPAGVYRIGPVAGGELWRLHGLRNVEIIADGVTLVGTKLTRAVTLDHCSGVTLQGLTVDYDPLPFTQGEVIAGAADGSHIDVRIHAGYPLKPYSRIDVVDRATRFRKKGMPFLWGTKAEMTGADTVRVHLEGIAAFAKTGDLVSLSTGQETGAPHAIAIDECSGIRLRNVTVHSAPGMGILEADGEGESSFQGCRIVPGPRPPGAVEDRLLSSSWDAFQSKTIRKGPLVENCEILDAGDDSWSVQSSDFLVIRRGDRSLVIASRDEYTAGPRVGDRLRSGLDGGECRITGIQSVPRNEAGLAPDVLEKLDKAEAWSLWKVSPKCLVVSLDRETKLGVGSCVYSPDRMGNGFIFRNNRIHSPGRILLKAGGLVEGNLLDTPHSLVVSPELPAEGAAGIGDLVIRNNKILRAGWFCAAPWSSQAGALSVTASAGKSSLRTVPVFGNLLIEGNTFDSCVGPNLVVASARHVVVRNNRFVSAQCETAPDTGKSYAIPGDAVIWAAHCEEMSCTENSFENTGPFAGEILQRSAGVGKATGFSEPALKTK